MTDIKLFVDSNNEITDKVLICQSNATKLGVKNGDSIEVLNIDNNLKKTATVEISDTILDFAGQFAKNLLDNLQFSGVELTVRPVSAAATLTPVLRVPKVPKPQPTPLPEPLSHLTPTPQPTLTPPPTPMPQPTPTPEPQPTLTPPPAPVPQPTPILTPEPQPALTPPPTPMPQPTPPPEPQPRPGLDTALECPPPHAR